MLAAQRTFHLWHGDTVVFAGSCPILFCMPKYKESKEPMAQTAPSLFSFPGFHYLKTDVSTNWADFSDLTRLSFFFDLDGTLLDLAPTPDAVRVEAGLQENLELLSKRTSGAVAIVTGRSIRFVDQLFPRHSFFVAGLHGAEFRFGSEKSSTYEMAHSNAERHDEWYLTARDMAKREADHLEGVIFEDKGGAFALHYRLAPDKEEAVRHIMTAAAESAGAAYSLQGGKFVFELKPAGSDKAQALHRFMRAAPFQSKFPVAAGDDLTDEAMFLEANSMRGASIRVGMHGVGNKTNASIVTQSPEQFRCWIGSLCK